MIPDDRAVDGSNAGPLPGQLAPLEALPEPVAAESPCDTDPALAGDDANAAEHAAADNEPASDTQPAPTVPLADAIELLTTMAESVQRLDAASERYHARAEQRESVITHLSSEADRLRRGDRREMLRPVLTEMCRLRNDLLRQAEGLPEDFSAERARLLLRSYADSVEMLLETNGVRTFAPDDGAPFDPRLHRRVSGKPAADAVAIGHVAGVLRDGYLDLDSSKPIVPAEVVVFTAPAAEPAEAVAGANNENSPGSDHEVPSGPDHNHTPA